MILLRRSQILWMDFSLPQALNHINSSRDPRRLQRTYLRINSLCSSIFYAEAGHSKFRHGNWFPDICAVFLNFGSACFVLFFPPGIVLFVLYLRCICLDHCKSHWFSSVVNHFKVTFGYVHIYLSFSCPSQWFMWNKIFPPENEVSATWHTLLKNIYWEPLGAHTAF